MDQSTKREYRLWDEFLERFPVEKLKTMKLEEYSQVGSEDSFTFWVERKLDSLGRITGTVAFKFGVFASNKPDMKYGNQYMGDGQYAWFKKYGSTRDEAFHFVRDAIIKIASAASIGDLETIDKIDLFPIYKWKVAFLYQNKENPSVTNTFKKEWLLSYLQAKGISGYLKNATFPQLYHDVVRHRGDLGLLEFGSTVWQEGRLNQAYNQIKNDFLNYYPGFVSFKNPPDKYLLEERRYKQELCEIYANEFAPRLHPLISDEKEMLELGKDLSTLFKRKLASENAPQNLVGWRYSEFTNKMSNEGYIAFAQAVSDLTNGDASLDERIPNFIQFLHKYSPDGKCGQAATRSMTTFFLFISDPHSHFFIKTEEVSKILKLFYLDPFHNDSLAPEEYYRVQRLAEEVYRLLEEDGLTPQDMIDVQSFFWSALSYKPEASDGATPSTSPPQLSEKKQSSHSMIAYPLNQILYGPPGTGKTYKTAQRAVLICDGNYPADRVALMIRYKELVADNRISFVSFHQSFSYEEFIEGIRPDLSSQSDSDHEQLIYRVEDGLFKKICSIAQDAIADLHRSASADVDLKGKKFYKMSVGGNTAVQNRTKLKIEGRY